MCCKYYVAVCNWYKERTVIIILCEGMVKKGYSIIMRKRNVDAICFAALEHLM